jgi:hypothetical protein
VGELIQYEAMVPTMAALDIMKRVFFTFSVEIAPQRNLLSVDNVVNYVDDVGVQEQYAEI